MALNDVDLARLAGIFEGDGSATKDLDGKGKIQFDNTDRSMLEATAAALGYGNDRIHQYQYSASAISMSATRLYPFVRSREKREKLEKCFLAFGGMVSLPPKMTIAARTGRPRPRGTCCS